ncbi:MAG: ATP-binding cassette domain-containing protein [Tissierellia bacterium]|nr:ATP-binding cassette domain-containing protein [Tissierellia bacterium]
MIELVDVSKVFDDGKNKVQAVSKVSLKVNKSEIYGIIGFSGAGKSTLLRCINLLERPTSGKVLFKGEDLTTLTEKELRKRRKKIGMIFQNFNLFNSRNVYDNIAYPLKGAKLSKEEEIKKIRALLDLVGLRDKEHAYPSQLSGGQKQRVAIARALANDPEVLLCDEATSALDPKTTKSILSLLKDLREKLGLTIILITHEMEVIKEICDRVAIMEDGRIIEEGSVIKIFSKPEKETTNRFIEGSSNADKVEELLDANNNILKIKEGEVLTRVHYLGQVTREAIISEASRKFNINASILTGNIEVINKTLIGKLLVLFSGRPENIEKGINYFKERGIKVEVIKDERNFTKLDSKCS